MGTLLLYTIPIALAIALSVFPIVAVLVLLLAADPMRRSVPFAAGWFAGLLILVAAFTVGAQLIPAGVRGPFPPWTHVAEIAIGVALIVMTLLVGGRSRKRPTPAEPLDMSRFTSGMTIPRAFAFGLMMNVRPKNIVLTVAGGIAIGAAVLDPVATATIVVIFTAVSASTVAALVVVYAVGKSRVRPSLERLRVFLVDHASLVLQVIGVLVGVILIVVGTLRLLNG